MLGSAAFMSPEQARGRALDARSDLWSLSAVLYRMLTGRLPFVGDNSADIVVRVCTEEVPPPSELRPELDERHDAFFRRALAKSADARFQDMDEFLDALDRLELRDSSRESRVTPTDVRRGSPSARGRTDETAPLRATDATSSLRATEAPLRAMEATASRDARSRRWAQWLLAAGLVLGLGVATWRLSSESPSVASMSSTTREVRAASSIEKSGAEEPPQRDVEPTRVAATSAEAPSNPARSASGAEAKGTHRPAKKVSSATRRSAAPASSAAAVGSAVTSPPPPTDPVFGLPVTDP